MNPNEWEKEARYQKGRAAALDQLLHEWARTLGCERENIGPAILEIMRSNRRLRAQLDSVEDSAGDTEPTRMACIQCAQHPATHCSSCAYPYPTCEDCDNDATLIVCDEHVPSTEVGHVRCFGHVDCQHPAELCHIHGTGYPAPRRYEEGQEVPEYVLWWDGTKWLFLLGEDLRSGEWWLPQPPPTPRTCKECGQEVE